MKKVMSVMVLLALCAGVSNAQNAEQKKTAAQSAVMPAKERSEKNPAGSEKKHATKPVKKDKGEKKNEKPAEKKK